MFLIHEDVFLADDYRLTTNGAFKWAGNQEAVTFLG